MATRHNVTIQLDRELIRKTRILAAKRGTSVSGLLASELKKLIGDDEAYESARRSALEFLKKEGFHLGGKKVSREELHERKTFVESNILVYAHDLDAADKNRKAVEIVRGLWANQSGIISMEVLQEFYVNSLGRFRSPLDRSVAREVTRTTAYGRRTRSIAPMLSELRKSKRPTRLASRILWSSWPQPRVEVPCYCRTM